MVPTKTLLLKHYDRLQGFLEQFRDFRIPEVALIFSTSLWPPEPLLQYPCVRAQQVSRFVLPLRFGFFDAGEKSQRQLGPPKCPSPPQKALRFVLVTKKSLAIAIPFAMIRGKERPHCGLAGDGNVCDRKPGDCDGVFWCSQVIDLLLGLSRGAGFHHYRVLENSPLALMGSFPSLMGCFPTLMGLNGPLPLLKTLWKTAH